MDFNVFYNYVMQAVIALNIETGEPELKIISYKYQDKDRFDLNNSLSDLKWNQIPNMIKGTEPTIFGQLDDIKCMHYCRNLSSRELLG